MYEVSGCGIVTCNTKTWIYDYCPKAKPDGPEGALAYNDNFCGQTSEVVTYLVQDSTYFIRVENIRPSCASYTFFTVERKPDIAGCTDSAACNYSPLATIDNGSCKYGNDPACVPDLVLNQQTMEESLRIDSIYIGESEYCLLDEACVQDTGWRTILRFATDVKNVGTTDFYIGRPDEDKSSFSSDNCHGHPHYEDYTHYLLFDKNGLKYNLGNKNGFCISDLSCDTGKGKYNCQFQGLSVGCEDIYDADVDCQWVDITDVPVGTYTLVNLVNASRKKDHLAREEKDFNNNWGQVCIEVSRQGNGITAARITNCPDFSDCSGKSKGTAGLDCEGNCNGMAQFGDLDGNGAIEDLDFQEYVELLLNEAAPASMCRDLNVNARLDLGDLYHLWKCANHEDSSEHTHQHVQCVFPKRTDTSEGLVQFKLKDLNVEDGSFVVAVHSGGTSISALQLSFNEIFVTSIENLIGSSDVPHDLNSLLWVNFDSPWKSDSFQPAFKVYYSENGEVLTMGGVKMPVNAQGKLVHRFKRSWKIQFGNRKPKWFLFFGRLVCASAKSLEPTGQNCVE